jgi:PIN domain nuclease of toxin-antitoxin system
LKLLLDTCTFLWLNSDLSRIPERIRRLCADESNQLYLSAVSAWEIAVKHHAGKLKLRLSPQEYVIQYRAANGISGLRFREDDAFYLGKLPLLHKDPFDRMLICQAIARGMTILTPDENIARYPVLTIW